MNIILLSGGSGQRLWPLSNNVRSKQFIKVLPGEGGEPESMVQRVYRQILAADPEARVTIATGRKQVSMIKSQLGERVGVCVEPDRRDTFPAISLAAAYLHDVQGVGEDEAVVICPVDPYVEVSYFEALKKLAELVPGSDSNLLLLGMEPTYPSEKYGYIIPADQNSLSRVGSFKEKPDLETAKQYLTQGALWNGGVFACKVGYLLKRAHEQLDFGGYEDLYAHYSEQKKISFDYAVVEKEPAISVLRYAGEWKDLGTWNTFTEAMGVDALGRVTMNETCENTHVVNELNLPILCMGLKDIVVAAGPDGILISDKGQSSYIKPFVEELVGQTMYAEKSWGSFTVLDVQEDSMTIKIVLLPGHQLHYHSHEHRDEVWTVLSGEGRVIVDGVEKKVGPGAVVELPAGCKHTLIADTKLDVLEAQLGDDITVEDKVKYEPPGRG